MLAIFRSKNRICKIEKMLTFKGETGNFEKTALVCDIIMLVIFIWDQIRYGMNLFFLIIPLVVIGVYLIVFCMMPEEYCFSESVLMIQHRFRRAVLIPYESVFNYESSARDSFVNIGHNNKVKLYYQVDDKKKAVICRPRDVESFVEAVRMKCPEFCEELDKKSRIEVFFDNGK